ncbi:hypothetical protein FB45DRAFT_1039283 [Roridomyces roridus]|uniref:Uncharacterized protein n=1 Tax=Roridomyces roridus TaxID=1738132 RepID=A0AAD7B2Y1_9AGAR|nr:hypothetical protein FB45DRAFT_1039283 [Roridomyces roridus]
MLQLLIKHSFRWEDLSLQLTPALIPPLATLQGRLPSLRRLWLQSDTPDSVQPISCFETAPSLVEIGVYRHDCPISLSPPIGQLTRYSVNAPWKIHLEILRTNPGLVEANIGVSPLESTWPLSGATIELLQLRRLCISHPEPLQYFKVAVLEHLVFDYPSRSDATSINPVADRFIEDTSSTVRSIVLLGYPNVDFAGQVLLRYPSITDLAVILILGSRSRSEFSWHKLHSVPEKLISLLKISDGSVVLAPHLSRIHFGVNTNVPFDYAMLECSSRG